jgi:hypothetical protein
LTFQQLDLARDIVRQILRQFARHYSDGKIKIYYQSRRDLRAMAIFGGFGPRI